MPKSETITRKLNRTKSNSEVNVPQLHEQTTGETMPNTTSTKKSTTTFLSLPRELRQQILYDTFTKHVEWEIYWYACYYHWKKRVRYSSLAHKLIQITKEVETWANDLRLAYPLLIDDVDFVEGRATGVVQQAANESRIEHFWKRRGGKKLE